MDMNLYVGMLTIIVFYLMVAQVRHLWWHYKQGKLKEALELTPEQIKKSVFYGVENTSMKYKK